MNHLFFTDDCVITSPTCDEILRVFGCYEQLSGLVVNRAKTQVFFSSNVQQSDCDLFTTLLVGVPASIGCSRRAAFEDLKSQVSSRLYGCKEKNLAIVGKEVLIKSVIQAIPSYVMSFFQLPVRLCKELTQTTAAYW